MPSAQRTTHPWLSAAGQPSHLALGAAGALGAALTALYSQIYWTIPVAVALYTIAVVRGALAVPRAQDPLAPAGPPIDWVAERRAVESFDARSLLERLEEVETRATQLAREAGPEARPILVASLVHLRDASRTGAQLARGIDRLEGVMRAARIERARADARALADRAAVHADATAAESLRAAARHRAQHARQTACIATLNERLKAEGEELLAQLQHAALVAEWSAARPLVFDRVRADTSVVRATLAELDALEPGTVELMPRVSAVPALAR